MIGADVSELRATGEAFAKAAEQISGQIEPALTKLVSATTWVGVDAAAFKGAWVLGYATRLKLVAARLTLASKQLKRNADAQDATSAHGGSFSPRIDKRGLYRGSRGPEGVERITPINPKGYGQPRTGLYGKHRDALDLNQAVYDHTIGDSHNDKIPGGWQEIPGDELDKMGLPRKLFGVEGQAFSAMLYRDVNGRYMLAFEGSAENKLDPDWTEQNVPGRIGFGAQDKPAINLALTVQAKLKEMGVPPENFAITGHSMGGRLAQLGGIATGAETITFNSAGVSKEAFEYAKQRSVAANVSGLSQDSYWDNITNYSHRNDVLYKAYLGGVDNNVVGGRLLIGESGAGAPGPLEAHGHDALRSAMKDEYGDLAL